MVTFIVGEEADKTTFLVHRHLAAAHSSFFKAAFESQMMEVMTQSTRLEDFEEETFGALVHWMYTEEPKAGKYSYTDDKIWNLADRFLMSDLQNAAMQRIFDNRSSATPEDVLPFARFVLSSGSEVAGTSKLQEFMLYYFVCDRGGDEFEDIVEELPRIFLNIAYLALQVVAKSRLPISSIHNAFLQLSRFTVESK
ncbi:hypothetical protein VTL71DRAFT_4512 [Oculimacula yallundae]|uniref:BTB domain-containing protein n=1 Tax=Oculimacula yallundae TaxID=86028 RepID=A0ABR4C246_9HELO